MEGKKDKSRSLFFQAPPAVAEATACLDPKLNGEDNFGHWNREIDPSVLFIHVEKPKTDSNRLVMLPITQD